MRYLGSGFEHTFKPEFVNIYVKITIATGLRNGCVCCTFRLEAVRAFSVRKNGVFSPGL